MKETQLKNNKTKLERKKKELIRKAETKRKIEKGGTFESFEREITNKQTETTKDVMYEFLKYVFSKDDMRNKLREITNRSLRITENIEEKNRDKLADEVNNDDEEI